ncbi:hypothetical protein M9H77_08002 [Catharanthus roseus]|uniref:Uncharacterized protein n=1 Tax=Catharanthus roseus TaxID=4058 RepID=A0ACC0BWS7_CATRO|nr:hypothetical protein M9H77_08002 [Catharanthus roseus]
MVRPSSCRGDDDDLGPVTGRTGRVQGCNVTASSRDVRGQHSTSDLLSSPTLLPAGLHYDTGAPGSFTQLPLGQNPFSVATSSRSMIYMYFPMFAPTVSPDTQSCKPYIQQYPILGYKTEHKLLDILLRLYTMLADEFGFRQCIPAQPLRSQEARRPANNRMYVVRNLFVEALWLEAPSHLLTETWTSILAIPPSSCTDDYMQWFLPRSHPRIQNPRNIPRGFHVPADSPMSPQALLDSIAREAR